MMTAEDKELLAAYRAYTDDEMAGMSDEDLEELEALEAKEKLESQAGRVSELETQDEGGQTTATLFPSLTKAYLSNEPWYSKAGSALGDVMSMPGRTLVGAGEAIGTAIGGGTAKETAQNFMTGMGTGLGEKEPDGEDAGIVKSTLRDPVTGALFALPVGWIIGKTSRGTGFVGSKLAPSLAVGAAGGAGTIGTRVLTADEYSTDQALVDMAVNVALSGVLTTAGLAARAGALKYIASKYKVPPEEATVILDKVILNVSGKLFSTAGGRAKALALPQEGGAAADLSRAADEGWKARRADNSAPLWDIRQLMESGRPGDPLKTNLEVLGYPQGARGVKEHMTEPFERPVGSYEEPLFEMKPVFEERLVNFAPGGSIRTLKNLEKLGYSPEEALDIARHNPTPFDLLDGDAVSRQRYLEVFPNKTPEDHAQFLTRANALWDMPPDERLAEWFKGSIKRGRDPADFERDLRGLVPEIGSKKEMSQSLFGKREETLSDSWKPGTDPSKEQEWVSLNKDRADFDRLTPTMDKMPTSAEDLTGQEVLKMRDALHTRISGEELPHANHLYQYGRGDALVRAGSPEDVARIAQEAGYYGDISQEELVALIKNGDESLTASIKETAKLERARNKARKAGKKEEATPEEVEESMRDLGLGNEPEEAMFTQAATPEPAPVAAPVKKARQKVVPSQLEVAKEEYSTMKERGFSDEEAFHEFTTPPEESMGWASIPEAEAREITGYKGPTMNQILEAERIHDLDLPEGARSRFAHDLELDRPDDMTYEEYIADLRKSAATEEPVFSKAAPKSEGTKEEWYQGMRSEPKQLTYNPAPRDIVPQGEAYGEESLFPGTEALKDAYRARQDRLLPVPVGQNTPLGAQQYYRPRQRAKVVVGEEPVQTGTRKGVAMGNYLGDKPRVEGRSITVPQRENVVPWQLAIDRRLKDSQEAFAKGRMDLKQYRAVEKYLQETARDFSLAEDLSVATSGNIDRVIARLQDIDGKDPELAKELLYRIQGSKNLGKALMEARAGAAFKAPQGLRMESPANWYSDVKGLAENQLPSVVEKALHPRVRSVLKAGAAKEAEEQLYPSKR